MSDLLVEYLNYVPSDLKNICHQWMTEYETNHAVKCNYKKFSIIAKSNDEEIIGILLGYTAFEEIYIEDICVKSRHRNKGIGTKLLKNVEKKFVNRGYNNINLVTSSFQAVEFYKKYGFKIEFIRENKQNPKFTKTFFIKYI